MFNNRELYKEKYDFFNNKQKEISSIESKILNSKNLFEQYNNTINKLNNNIQTITSNIAKSVGFLEDLENEKTQVETKLKESEQNYSKNFEIKENLEKEISDLRVNELELKSNINNVKDKIEFFQTLINNLEGVSKGSKSLIESEGWTKNKKILLADVGSPNEDYRFAIETVLKPILNNLLIESTEELLSAIDYLKKNELGKASFILKSSKIKNGVLNKINAFALRRKSKSIKKHSSFLFWANELIEYDEKWKNYFDVSLDRVAIVKTLKDAITLRKNYSEFSFVTPDGDFINDFGIVEAGSSTSLEETLFGRRKLLDDLKNEYPKLENNLVKLQEFIEEKEEIVSKINLKNISEQGKIFVNDINNIEKQISQLEYEKKKSAADIENIQDEIQESVSQLNISEKNQNQFTAELTEKSFSIDSLKNELGGFESNLNSQEDSFSTLQSNFNNSQVELQRIKGDIQNTTSLLSKANESKASLIRSIEKLHHEIKTSEDEASTISANIEDTQFEYDEINADKNIRVEELEKIESELVEKKKESSELEHNLNNVRNERQTISDNIHQIQVKQNEKSIRLENLVNHIRDEYSITLEKKEFDDIDSFNFKDTSAEVHSLKEKLKGLGPINLLAYSEYEEENERLQFLEKQRTDLINSEKDLINTIKDINESAESVFMETFAQIKTNFQTIFQSVFNPGDEADLVLEEGVDPLEAKIEIIAKPKGKRPTGIELLSGGEKTLTATALLFAIYLVKPSPFCIMDEVDAPLDDANIDRFTKLLKDFSHNTQFIIVTHNKRTMEAAENMYGVTIQEEGVSKLVGVQFNEELGIVN